MTTSVPTDGETGSPAESTGRPDSGRSAAPSPAVVTARRTWALWVIAVIGLTLATMPVAFNMFQRAPKGATMIVGFRPFMTDARLAGYQIEIGQIDAAVHQTEGGVYPYLVAHGQTPPSLAVQFPSMASLSSQWPGIDTTMSGLMNRVQANLGNYRAVAALPSFTLFPWFFVIPGLLLLGLAILALAVPAWTGRLRWLIVAVGVGLVLAPAAFQMFQRAPDGGRMMTAFESIETTGKVEQIQDYFGTMAAGQGELRLDIVPALEQSGLTQAQVVQQFPAVAALDQNWDHILNDMTPMIGAMSDNVANYQAIRSLPPFALFPWFFVIPGAAVVAVGLLVRPLRGNRSAGAPR